MTLPEARREDLTKKMPTKQPALYFSRSWSKMARRGEQRRGQLGRYMQRYASFECSWRLPNLLERDDQTTRRGTNLGKLTANGGGGDGADSPRRRVQKKSFLRGVTKDRMMMEVKFVKPPKREQRPRQPESGKQRPPLPYHLERT